MRKHADGAWYTKDGQGRVVRKGPHLWHAEELLAGNEWAWVWSADTKFGAIVALQEIERQFIW